MTRTESPNRDEQRRLHVEQLANDQAGEVGELRVRKGRSIGVRMKLHQRWCLSPKEGVLAIDVALSYPDVVRPEQTGCSKGCRHTESNTGRAVSKCQLEPQEGLTVV